LNKKLIYFLFAAISLLYSEAFPQYYYNQFADLDGVNDYFAAPSQSEITPDSIFTIEGWIFLKDTTGFNKTILSKVDATNNNGYALIVRGSSASPGNAGRMQLNLNGSNNIFSQSSGTRLALNAWTYFAVTFINGSALLSDTVKFYVNGALVQTLTSIQQPLTNTTDSLRAGNCYLPGNYLNGLKGYLDDLRIYKTVRPAGYFSNDRGVPVSLNQTFNPAILTGTRYANITASWNFNGTGSDNIGVQNNFTPVNGAGFKDNSFNPDFRNQSNYNIRLDGLSWLSAPDSTNSSLDADTACTIEAWVYPDTLTNANQTIVSKGSLNNYLLGIKGTLNVPFFSLNNGSKSVTSNKPLKAKEWTQITAVYRAATGTMNLYRNGIPDTAVTFTPGPITVNNDSLLTGRDPAGEYFTGRIDELRISRYAKTQAQIIQYLFTSIDKLNNTASQSAGAVYNFEGNTLNTITQSNPLIIRNNAYFEWENLVNTAAGVSQAPLIRTSAADNGISGNYFLNSGSFSIRNNSTIRDSILISGMSSPYSLNVLTLLSHTYINDVVIQLRAPNGVSINLSSNNGQSFNDLMTLFSDQSDSSITKTGAPYSMKIKPSIPLSGLQSSSPNGYWRITVIDNNAGNVDSGKVYRWGLKFLPPVSLSENNYKTGYSLSQNYPNPFNPVTEIKYSIPNAGNVKLIVYDALGRELSVPVNGRENAGEHSIIFNASELSTGIYFYRITAGSYSQTKKMLLIK
jgi:subtilisin-like proprotein convertase family protein